MKRVPSWTTFAATLAIVVGGCTEAPTDPIRSPLIPPAPPSNPQILSAAWTMDVDRTNGKVAITPPKAGQSLGGLDMQVFADYFGVEPGHPDFSILAGDVVTINADNSSFVSNPVGLLAPGLVRTQFEVSITNKLTGVSLATPTFPAPPVGTSGVILFPFEIVVTETPGGVTGGLGDGTIVLVELPNFGQVAPSVDWDVNPFNFFNDTGCIDSNNTNNPTTDCYRSETFGSIAGPIVEGGATSLERMIGFDHDPTVSQFRVRMIVAADIQDATPNTPPTAEAGGPYAGNRGVPINLAGSGVDTDPGASLTYAWDFDGDTQFDDATGATPSFTCLAGGAVTVVLRVTDNRGATATDTAIINCTDALPVAEANGPYTQQVGSGVTLSSAGSTDDGTITARAWDLDNNGSFETSGASPVFTCSSVANFTVVLRVTDDAAQTDTDNATVNCVSAPAGVISWRWVNGSGAPITSVASGGTAFLQADIDAAAAQRIGSVTLTVNFPTARLVATAAADLACAPGGTCPAGVVPAGNADDLTSLTPNTSNPGQVTVLNVNLASVPSQGAIHGITSITFTAGSAGAAVVPTFTINEVTDENSADITSQILANAMPGLTIN